MAELSTREHCTLSKDFRSQQEKICFEMHTIFISVIYKFVYYIFIIIGGVIRLF